MNQQYEIVELSPDERAILQRTYQDLWTLSSSRIPAIRSAARASLAQITQALNGQTLDYRLYTQELSD